MRIPSTRWLPFCIALLAGTPIVLAAPSGRSAPAGADEAAIERVIRTSIDWALDKDTAALFDCFARDSTLFIFHPDSKSTIVGFEAFRKMAEGLFLDPRFKALDSRFENVRIQRSTSGETAWFSCLLDDHGEWDGRPMGWDDARWTGVLEKRNGRWIIVQMHFSLAEDQVESLAFGGRSFSALTGPYLGQKRPGSPPDLFAPERVSAWTGERDVAISPDGREIYFGLLLPKLVTIMVTRLVDGHWTEPEVASFAADGRYSHLEPSLSADGKRILFLTTRPTAGEKDAPGWSNQNIFAADRGAGGSWGAPYDLGAPVNTSAPEFFPAQTRDGTLYFTRGESKSNTYAILRARLAGGRYQEPEALPAAVNGQGVPYNAFVSPDEDYLVACVDGRTDGAEPGRPQYFIFFRDPADRWSEGVCLGPEVSPAGSGAGSPYVSPDGKYFFFGSARARETPAGAAAPLTLRALRAGAGAPRNGDSDIYWMDAAVLRGKRRGPGN
jgi:ketosteroid isomerase-like protein